MKRKTIIPHSLHSLRLPTHSFPSIYESKQTSVFGCIHFSLHSFRKWEFSFIKKPDLWKICKNGWMCSKISQITVLLCMYLLRSVITSFPNDSSSLGAKLYFTAVKYYVSSFKKTPPFLICQNLQIWVQLLPYFSAKFTGQKQVPKHYMVNL